MTQVEETKILKMKSVFSERNQQAICEKTAHLFLVSMRITETCLWLTVKNQNVAGSSGFQRPKRSKLSLS